MTITRQVILIPDEDGVGYTVEVPSLPGCISEGDTLEEALAAPGSMSTISLSRICREFPLSSCEVRLQGSWLTE
jgi:hypothetical protein